MHWFLWVLFKNVMNILKELTHYAVDKEGDKDIQKQLAHIGPAVLYNYRLSNSELFIIDTISLPAPSS